MALRACLDCGRPTHHASRRCSNCSLPGRPRGNKVTATRERILNRDGWRCQDCGRQLSTIPYRPDSAHVAHRTPHVEHGAYTDTNLFASCQACNLATGNKPRPEVAT